MILTFSDADERNRFASQVRLQRLDIFNCFTSLRNFPQIVAEELTEEQQAWVKAKVQPIGRAFDDVQFEPMTEFG